MADDRLNGSFYLSEAREALAEAARIATIAEAIVMVFVFASIMFVAVMVA